MVGKCPWGVWCLILFFVVTNAVKASFFFVSRQSVVRVTRSTKVNSLSVFWFALCAALTLTKDRHPFLFGIRTLFDLQKTHLLK